MGTYENKKRAEGDTAHPLPGVQEKTEAKLYR